MPHLASCLCVCLLTLAAPQETVLPLDVIDGIRPTYRSDAPRILEIATGEDRVTEGAAAVRFGGRAPTAKGNKYLGIMVPFPEPVDLRGQAIKVDARTPLPATTRAFYVRLYNQNEDNPVWSYNSWNDQLREEWRTFTFQHGLCLDGLSWENTVVNGSKPTKVDRIEFIIGTGQDDVDVSAVVDNVRIVPRKPGIDELTAPKTLTRDTYLVRDGKPSAVVLHPDSEAGRAAAAEIVGAVKTKTGVVLPTRVATTDDRQPNQTAIMLGNVVSNPAMLLLYARFMTPVDAVCPGPGGSLVHTVFDPFGKGLNVVVAGASDDSGLTKAAGALARAIEALPEGANLNVPRLFERNYSEAFLKRYKYAGDEVTEDYIKKGVAQGQEALDKGTHTSVAGVLANVARKYQLTGESAYAKVFVKLWELYATSAVADPRKFGGPWGFDSDFKSMDVVAGWRIIEYDPALTDQERLGTVKSIARWMHEAVVPSCVGAVGNERVPHNHQTFPTLGTLMAGLYFTQGFDVAEGEQWLGIADAIFTRQAGYFKPYEDCNGYQWLTNGHLMRYTVARPDFTLYENGNARRIIDYCIGVMDNLGYQVPYGDTGSWQCWDSETLCLNIFAHVTGDEAAAWAAAKKIANKNTLALYTFQSSDAGSVPEDYTGVRMWPLEPQYYVTHSAETRPALENCFDKVSFRENMDPAGFYALLDGLNNGGHKHFDGNSIPRITQYERIWLADNDYYKSAVKYHNSVMVFRDGESSVIPPYVAFLGVGETSRYGFSQTRVTGYAGADWERTIVWLKKVNALAVLDRLTARETNDYQFRILWHGVGEPAMDETGLLLTQNGPAMRIQVSPGPVLSLYNDHELGTNWKGYPHAKPVVRSLSAIAKTRLEKDAAYLVVSALHASPEGPPSPWQVQVSADRQGAVLNTPDGPIVISLNARPIETGDGVLDTDAQVVIADAAGLTLLGASHARLGPKEVLNQGASVDVPIKDMPERLANIPVREPESAEAPNAGVPAHQNAWRLALETAADNESTSCDITRLAPARLDGSDKPPLPLASTGQGLLFAVNANGAIRWTRDIGAPLNDVTADDLDGDGIDEIVVARQDHNVTVLDASGSERWSRELEYYRRPPYVNLVRTGDITGDGLPEVVAGGENWRFYAFTGTGEALWNYESVHPSRSGAVADLDGDGKAEVLCGTHYYYMSALNPDGTRRWRHNFGPICYDIATGSFNTDDTRGVICGGGGGFVHYLGHDGALRMQYNTGDEVRCVAAHDLDGDGRDEILAGSRSHSVYCFGPDGGRRWRTDLGAPITALATASSQSGAFVLAGTDAGRLVTLDSAGGFAQSTDLGAEIRDLLVLGGHAVAATTTGELLAFDIK